ncbi:MAG TPA: intradiol ring-cleavage dioxygenase [Acidimicrobiales bacterium]|nr:intradiol ring-cleavage dioxygenase [Acidimicrobiales bacterium]
MTSGHDHDRGLSFDLRTMAGRRLMDRRRALQVVAGAGLAALVGCGSGDDGGRADATTTSTERSTSTAAGSGARSAGGSAECSTIPEETAGPFPGDGSNGPDVLAADGIVRADIRPSFGSATGRAEGVPVTLDLEILDGAGGCAPLAGAAVYVWHCDRDGRYSLYSPGATGENYLRGVQPADADGAVSFATIFPGCYPGRWPHIHFEVYPSVADATGGGSALVTSQLAIPEDACNQVYAADGYAQSVTNLEALALESDMVFADGTDLQLATATGSAVDGFALRLSMVV